MNDPFAVLEAAAKRSKAEEDGARALSETRSLLVLDRTAQGAFFATLAMGLKPIQDFDIETACTDGKHLAYNPTWFVELDREQRIGLLAHEVMHCAQKHMCRRGVRDPQKWNIACDLAINQQLLKANYTLPEGGCIPGKGSFAKLKEGLSAEEYYTLLPDQLRGGNKKNGDGDEGGGGGQGDDPGGDGGVKDAGDGSSAAAGEASAEWDVRVLQAAEVAKQRGNLPAGLEDMIGAIREPKVDWRNVLREFLTVHARNDYAWFPPNRRFISAGLYLPGMRSEEIGDILVVVDTSGSCWDKLGEFASEIEGILQAYSCEVRVLYHDAAVQHVHTWKATDGPFKLEPRGGGGTSHIPVFEYVEKEALDPTCMVLLTDMYSEFPKQAPAYPTLWCSVAPCTAAPFGRLLLID